MKNFKTIKLLSIGLISSIGIMAQQPPTNNNPSGNASGTNDRRFWSRAGNTNANGNNNIFGTMWDSPIYTYTAGINRMVVNGTNVNYAGIPTPGYIGIGFNPTDIRSRLTITGTNNTSFGGGGYRSWMKTGITFTSNHDLAYLGMRSVGGISNLTEFTATATYSFYN